MGGGRRNAQGGRTEKHTILLQTDRQTDRGSYRGGAHLKKHLKMSGLLHLKQTGYEIRSAEDKYLLAKG